MDAKRLVGELCLVAERLGLEVRREPLDGAAGGFCVLKRRPVVLLDPTLPADDQADVLAAALAEACRTGAAKADLDDVFILPEVRAFLEGGGFEE